MQAITIISPPIQKEFAVKQISMIVVAKYVGLVIGSSLWPMTADIIGRKTAFNRYVTMRVLRSFEDLTKSFAVRTNFLSEKLFSLASFPFEEETRRPFVRRHYL